MGVALLRALLTTYRSHRAKHLKLVLLSILIAAALLFIFSAIVVVLFAYAVAHTGKSAENDLIVLFGTLALAYMSSLLAWWACSRMDRSHGKI